MCRCQSLVIISHRILWDVITYLHVYPKYLLLAPKPSTVNFSFISDLEEVDITDYVASNEWTLLEYPAVRNVKYYPCCIEPYIDLTFTIKVKRMGAFYSYILILPCVLLSFLTLVTFWLPPESSNKMLLGQTCEAFWITLYDLIDTLC